MNMETILAYLSWGMEMMPFPMLLLYGILLGLLWLFIESLLTRTARATPKWKRPFPVLPAISEVASWLTRGCSWLLWTWAILYFALVIVHWVDSQPGAELTAAADALAAVATTWRQLYATAVGWLPPVVVGLLPGV